MRIEEVVGRRIRDIRESQGMTQEQLGQEIGKLLGKPWPRQTVSLAEQGRRAFTAAELVACSLALGAPVAELFTPLTTQEGIELTPGGAVVDTRKAMAIMFEGEDMADLRDALTTLIDHAQQVSHSSSLIIANARLVLDNLARVVPAVESHADHGT